jgi:hypothetical protein
MGFAGRAAVFLEQFSGVFMLYFTCAAEIFVALKFIFTGLQLGDLYSALDAAVEFCEFWCMEFCMLFAAFEAELSSAFVFVAALIETIYIDAAAAALIIFFLVFGVLPLVLEIVVVAEEFLALVFIAALKIFDGRIAVANFSIVL